MSRQARLYRQVKETCESYLRLSTTYQAGMADAFGAV
jgi:hypothetical protein